MHRRTRNYAATSHRERRHPAPPLHQSSENREHRKSAVAARHRRAPPESCAKDCAVKARVPVIVGMTLAYTAEQHRRSSRDPLKRAAGRLRLRMNIADPVRTTQVPPEPRGPTEGVSATAASFSSSLSSSLSSSGQPNAQKLRSENVWLPLSSIAPTSK